MLVTERFLSLASCILTSVAFGDSAITFALKKYEDRKSIKKTKINSPKSKWVAKTVITQYVKSTGNIFAKNVGKIKTEQTENNGELFQEF